MGRTSGGSRCSAAGCRGAKVLEFFASQPRCVIALEACGGAHHWARQLIALGHEVWLIAPAYVKPFVKRNTNDALDAETICEAAQRPNMRFVTVKSEEQQAAALVFRTRDLLVRQRAQTINAIRSHMAEYGWVAPEGPSHVAALGGLLEELPEAARAMIRVMFDGSTRSIARSPVSIARSLAVPGKTRSLVG